MIVPRIALATAALCPLLSTAQTTAPREAPRHIVVGSSDEDYLRYLQITGLANLYPWSSREFSQAELARLNIANGSHPRSGKGDYTDPPKRFAFTILPLNSVLRYNTSFPYGSGDGAVWAGRGLTSAIDVGFVFRSGPLSGAFNPIAFWSQNRAFQLQPNGSSSNPFADPVFPSGVDRPQRFGTHSYSRVDLGQSTLRLDALGLAGGISNANMIWGPMESYPYILSGNAPGFLHAFAGTGAPTSIWVGRIHARVIWGQLEQSEYSLVRGTSYYSSRVETGTKRFASGAVAVFQPRGLDGLEVGAARFFHSLWPKEGIPGGYFGKPFTGLFKGVLGKPSASGVVEDNQLASLFARWVFPKSGFEAYGEYGHDDNNYDKRDVVQEPDHSRSYGLGIRKVISADSGHLTAIRAEMINYELPTLARNRNEGGTYIHGTLGQGHTNRGQLLGSDTGVGSGGGSLLAWDKYDKRGTISVNWTRTIRQQSGTFYIDGAPDSRANDVQNAFTFSRARYRGNGELTTGVTMVREFNRDLQGDAWNINLTVGFRIGLGRAMRSRPRPIGKP